MQYTMRTYFWVLVIGLLVAFSCARKPEQKVSELTLVKPAQSTSRIISLAPSFTQIVCELGLEKNLVGVAELNQQNTISLGNFPPAHSIKESEKRKNQCLRLNPTLILAHSYMFKTETTKTLQPILRNVDIEISDLRDLLRYILLVSKITHSLDRGIEIVKGIQNSLREEQIRSIKNMRTRRILLVVGDNPLRVLGHGSFFSSILENYTTIRNVSPSPAVVVDLDPNDINILAPEAIVDLRGQGLSSFSKLSTASNKPVLKGDPKWLIPGPNIIDSVENINKLIHSQKF